MLVPKVVMALRTLIPLDEVKACEALEALDEMLETELPIITPNLSEVLTFCLEVAKNVALSEALRVRILCCLTFLVKVKSKVSPLWRCYPIPPSLPLVVFGVLALLRSWPGLLFLPRRRGSSGWAPVVGRMGVSQEPVLGCAQG